MSKRVKTLTKDKVRFDIKGIEKCQSFQYILSFVLAQKPRMESVSCETRSILSVVDKFYWRPEDIYFLNINEGKIPCTNIFHSGIHFLLARRYGAKQTDRPQFVLLCEAIASLSEFYFKLESFLLIGLDKTLENYIANLISTRETYVEKKRSGTQVMKLFNESLENPYSAFREATIEMYTFYLHMYDIAIQRRNGRSLNIESVVDRVRRMKYASVIYNYDLSNNILYALNCGNKSRAEDSALVKDIINILNQSSTFEEFLLALGIGISEEIKSVV